MIRRAGHIDRDWWIAWLILAISLALMLLTSGCQTPLATATADVPVTANARLEAQVRAALANLETRIETRLTRIEELAQRAGPAAAGDRGVATSATLAGSGWPVVLTIGVLAAAVVAVAWVRNVRRRRRRKVERREAEGQSP